MNEFRHPASKAWFEMVDKIERYEILLKLFDDHYICEDCDKYAATYLEKCKNPLHKLHDAAWEIEQ
jgi:hypothetical protein